MQDPLKQGLKHYNAGIAVGGWNDSNARSTKTRIETSYPTLNSTSLLNSNARSTKTRIETACKKCISGPDVHYSNARSTKTRIETCFFHRLRDIIQIRMQDPLKQGLKLDCIVRIKTVIE